MGGRMMMVAALHVAIVNQLTKRLPTTQREREILTNTHLPPPNHHHRYGHRTLYILMGPILLLATHFVFLLGGTSALVPLCGLGLAYRLVSVPVC